jgi:hypothetical protein
LFLLHRPWMGPRQKYKSTCWNFVLLLYARIPHTLISPFENGYVFRPYWPKAPLRERCPHGCFCYIGRGWVPGKNTNQLAGGRGQSGLQTLPSFPHLRTDMFSDPIGPKPHCDGAKRLQPALTAALNGVHTVVSVTSAVDGSQAKIQINLLEAAVKAGC